MVNIKLKYNVLVEVTKSQYDEIRSIGAGLVTFREENNKFFIRPLIMKFTIPIKEIEKILNR